MCIAVRILGKKVEMTLSRKYFNCMIGFVVGFLYAFFFCFFLITFLWWCYFVAVDFINFGVLSLFLL